MALPEFRLRPANLNDVVPYTYFLADPEVSRWLDDSAQTPMSTGEVEALLLRNAWCLWSVDFESRFVGVTSFYEPDLRRGTARFSIVLGDRDCWGKGLGTAVTAQAVDHAFNRLGLRKIESDYLAPHAASRTIHERNGFVEEGTLRADAWRDGQWIDRVVVSLLREEWPADGPIQKRGEDR